MRIDRLEAELADDQEHARLGGLPPEPALGSLQRTIDGLQEAVGLTGLRPGDDGLHHQTGRLAHRVCCRCKRHLLGQRQAHRLEPQCEARPALPPAEAVQAEAADSVNRLRSVRCNIFPVAVRGISASAMKITALGRL